LRRQVLAAACAAGVSATFGAPVGGVLFSIEVTSTYYSISHLWKAMFTSVCGALLFRVTRVYGSLALFRLTDFSVQDTDAGLSAVLYTGEIYAFALLGLLCGLLGAAFVHATSSLVQLVRQLRASIKTARPPPTLMHDSSQLSSCHAAVALQPGSLLSASGGMTATSGAALTPDVPGTFIALSALAAEVATLDSLPSPQASSVPSHVYIDRWSFRPSRKKLVAESGSSSSGTNSVGGCGECCDRLRMEHTACTAKCVFVMLLSRYGYTIVVAFTSAMLTFPFGFFGSSPEDVINELFGAAPIDFNARWANPSLLINLSIYTVCKFAFTVVAVGCPISCGVFTPVFLIGAAAGRAFGEALNAMLAAELQITAGAYAVVGAAAMAAGVTRTISCAVMVFELTGQLNHMLPVLVAVLGAYGVGNIFNQSIYDTMLDLNNLPYLRPPDLASENQQHCAHDVMDTAVVGLTCTCSYLDVHLLLLASEDAEFAIVDNLYARHLLGTVRRSTLAKLLHRRMLSDRQLLYHASSGTSRWDLLRNYLGGLAYPVVPPALLRLFSPPVADERDMAEKARLSPSGIQAQEMMFASNERLSQVTVPELSAGTLREVFGDDAPSTRVSIVGVSAALSSPHPPTCAADHPSSMAKMVREANAEPRSTDSCPIPEAPSQSVSDTSHTAPVASASIAPAVSTANATDVTADEWSIAQGAGVLCGEHAGQSLGSKQQEAGRRIHICYTDFELSLLREPLNLGIDGWSRQPGADIAGETHLLEMGPTQVGLVQHAPNITVAGAPIHQVHMQFSVLGLERTYVTYAGRLLGIIRRSQLGGR